MTLTQDPIWVPTPDGKGRLVRPSVSERELERARAYDQLRRAAALVSRCCSCGVVPVPAGGECARCAAETVAENQAEDERLGDWPGVDSE